MRKEDATTSFFQEVYKVVAQIPKGKVATYGQVAALCGKPRAARVVGWALRQVDGKKINVPWQRVVAAKGCISIANPNYPRSLQKELLAKEGIDAHWDKKLEKYQIDIQKYLWNPKL